MELTWQKDTTYDQRQVIDDVEPFSSTSADCATTEGLVEGWVPIGQSPLSAGLAESVVAPV